MAPFDPDQVLPVQRSRPAPQGRASAFAIHRWSRSAIRLAPALALLGLIGIHSAPAGFARPAPAPGTGVLPPGANPYPALDTDLYILGPGDQLALRFLDPSAGDIGGNFEVLNDGTATLALIGSVQLTGLTLGQANRWLTSVYSRLLVRPELFLQVVRTRPMTITVIGEVERPGLYQLNPRGEGSAVEGAPATNPGFPTVVTAIQKAGGITLAADVRNVTLRRRLPGFDGQQKQMSLNLAELLQVGNQRQNPLIFDGDTVVVAKASAPLPDEVLRLSATNLSPQSINVNVIGEVKRPGRIQLPANVPLVQAVLAAGGPDDWRANTGNVELVRVNRNGTAQRQVFKLDYSRGVSNGLNPPLRDNDTVIVNRSVYGETVDVLRQVVVPLTSVANFLNYYYLWDTRFNR
jgi:polysaccharide export outer membrane protein